MTVDDHLQYYTMNEQKDPRIKNKSFADFIDAKEDGVIEGDFDFEMARTFLE